MNGDDKEEIPFCNDMWRFELIRSFDLFCGILRAVQS
jgi:hypothetical protein